MQSNLTIYGVFFSSKNKANMDVLFYHNKLLSKNKQNMQNKLVKPQSDKSIQL